MLVALILCEEKFAALCRTDDERVKMFLRKKSTWPKSCSPRTDSSRNGVWQLAARSGPRPPAHYLGLVALACRVRGCEPQTGQRNPGHENGRHDLLPKETLRAHFSPSVVPQLPATILPSHGSGTCRSPRRVTAGHEEAQH